MQNETNSYCDTLKAIIDSLSEYCHVLGQPSTLILSSIELLRMEGIDEATRKLACDTCYDAAMDIRRILQEMKAKCAYNERGRSEAKARIFPSSTDTDGLRTFCF